MRYKYQIKKRGCNVRDKNNKERWIKFNNKLDIVDWQGTWEKKDLHNVRNEVGNKR